MPKLTLKHNLSCDISIMEISSTLWYVFAGVLAVVLQHLLSTIQRRRRAPPGPFPLPVIGNLLQLRGLPHRCFADLGNIYGHLMTLELGKCNTVIISSSDVAREVFRKNDVYVSDRFIPDCLHARSQYEKSVIWLPHNQLWKDLRKMYMTVLFTTQKLDQFKGLRQQKVRELLAYIGEKGDSRGIDIAQAVSTTMLNLLSNTSFSVDMIDISSKSSQEMRDLMIRIMEIIGTPNVVDLFPILAPFDPQRLRQRMKENFGKLYDYFDQMIDKRKSEKDHETRYNDILEEFLRSKFDIQTLRSAFTSKPTQTLAVPRPNSPPRPSSDRSAPSPAPQRAPKCSSTSPALFSFFLRLPPSLSTSSSCRLQPSTPRRLRETQRAPPAIQLFPPLIEMDREWIVSNRLSDEYENGVNMFLEVAKKHSKKMKDSDMAYCPCNKCHNMSVLTFRKMKDHLFEKGFDPNYRRWIWHGENESCSRSKNDGEDVSVEDHLEEMVQDMAEKFSSNPDLLGNLLSDNEKPLYKNCTKFTRLSAVLKLYNLKAGNGWSDVSFTSMLKLVKEMLPDDNELPDRTYDAKKVLCPMGMEYRKIHACPNDCILYRGEFENLHSCPRCNVSRYKMKRSGPNHNEEADEMKIKGPPAKILWYLPIIPRLKRLFAGKEDSKNMTWHADREKPNDQLLRHPADSPQWKKINVDFPVFGEESRNVRLGLCTDGMNPFGSLSSIHSSWPVLLVIYNLPPWLCMKRKYIMLSLMISGPKQPGNDIDVYLRPLIDDLKKLWGDGESVFDSYRQESFVMRAMIFCTINDFPAYGNLSGYSVKGHKACPICEENTCSLQLVNGSKTVYLGHRRFLPNSHPYRRLKKAFNGKQEFQNPPVEISVEKVYERVRNIECEFGKPYKRANDKSSWKKRSIFFDLPYWKTLEVRHCIDVMHVEKNVCDSLVGTLLNIPGKTKDGYNARLDLVDIGIRAMLAPEKKGDRNYLPPASYTLSRKEKKILCQCLHDVRVPQGYSSNISNLVVMKDLKLVGMKSHDCHTLMQQLLPVALRSILPKDVRQAIIKLCSFFNKICSKVVDPVQLDKLQNEIVVTLCQLEMFFPPAFFDIMIHLVIHLVREVKLCGPVFLRWMYPFERYMKVLKGYCKNRQRPDASIVEGYIAEEVIEFCTGYLANTKTVGLPKNRHDNRVDGKGTRGMKMLNPNGDDLMTAYFYVLCNSNEVQPYLNEHMKFLKERNPLWSDQQVINSHNKNFISWFKNLAYKRDVSETIQWLAYGPHSVVISYSGYDINGYSFYTVCEDAKSAVQNSGVTLIAESLHVSSSKDKNPVYADMSYYGVIEDIWELDFVKFKVPIFRCKWADNKTGVRVDDYGFTLIDFSKQGYKGEPFILASQAKQVFYVADSCDKKWAVILEGKKKIVSDDSLIEYEETPPFSKQAPELNSVDEEINVETCMFRDDHGEGIWIENPLRKKKTVKVQKIDFGMSEEQASNLSPPSPIARCDSWKRARVNSRGEYVTDESQAIGSKIDSLKLRESQGEFASDGRNDILREALGNDEHPGRVRGVGSRVGLRQYFGKTQRSTSTTGHTKCQQEIADLKKSLQLLSERLDRALPTSPTRRKTGSSTETTPVPPVFHHHRHDDFVSHSRELALIDGPSFGKFVDGSRCALFVEDPDRRLVGHGKVYNISRHHFTEVGEGELKVAVESCLDPGVFVPFPEEEIVTLGDAIGGFVRWHSYLVELNDKHEVSSPRSKGSNNQSPININSLPSRCKMLYQCMVGREAQSLSTLELEGDKGLPPALYVTKEDIMQFMAMDSLCIMIIDVQVKHLYDARRSIFPEDQVFGFISPSTYIYGNDDKSGQLGTFFKEEDKKYYLLPYHERAHWMLVVVCPTTNSAYWFDPLGSNKPRDSIKKLLNMAIKVYRALGGRRTTTKSGITWHGMRYRKQVGNTECGYYVMRYMEEILDVATQDVCLTEVFPKSSDPFSQQELDETRDRWARYFIRNMLTN